MFQRKERCRWPWALAQPFRPHGLLVVVAPFFVSGVMSMQAQDRQTPSAPTVLLPAPSQQNPSQPSVLLPQPSPQVNAANQAASAAMPPCKKSEYNPGFQVIFLPGKAPCQEQDPLQLIVDAGPVRPLTPEQKGLLAARAVVDPFNLITIVGFSGISVAANAHSAYGPGFAGWGRLIGYSLAEDIQGELTGTFLLPVAFHEDPRYHRMGSGRPFLLRAKHALIHTVVTQHDDGSLMPNYATLINYPLSAEISNLYVPAVGVNAPDTFKRVVAGYATDPVGAIVAEFLPDVAKRIHIHILFAQQILNRIALGQNNGQQ